MLSFARFDSFARKHFERLMNSARQTQINLLNVGLMLLSCVLAYLLPLELFLFSYAVLGPLHYLTEISWLQKRDYFMHGPREYLFLAGLCVPIFLFSYFNLGLSSSVFLGIGFGGALALVSFRQTRQRVLFILLVAVVALLLQRLRTYQVFVGLFLPTIIHVYVFTGLFILYGALKGRSLSGYLSLGVFIACGAIFFIYTPALTGISDNAYVRESYQPFQRLNLHLSRFFGLSEINRADTVYVTPSGLALVRFVAFAYTYHYLNWFSKTSVIKWHEVSRTRLVSILALWLCALLIYALDFRTGLIVLLALSFAHVVLEFPLNHQTMRGIARELRTLSRPRAAVRDVRFINPHG